MGDFLLLPLFLFIHPIFDKCSRSSVIVLQAGELNVDGDIEILLMGLHVASNPEKNIHHESTVFFLKKLTNLKNRTNTHSNKRTNAGKRYNSYGGDWTGTITLCNHKSAALQHKSTSIPNWRTTFWQAHGCYWSPFIPNRSLLSSHWGLKSLLLPMVKLLISFYQLMLQRIETCCWLKKPSWWNLHTMYMWYIC